jgi:hypothetical protein
VPGTKGRCQGCRAYDRGCLYAAGASYFILGRGFDFRMRSGICFVLLGALCHYKAVLDCAALARM